MLPHKKNDEYIIERYSERRNAYEFVFDLISLFSIWLILLLNNKVKVCACVTSLVIKRTTN